MMKSPMLAELPIKYYRNIIRIIFMYEISQFISTVWSHHISMLHLSFHKRTKHYCDCLQIERLRYIGLNYLCFVHYSYSYSSSSDWSTLDFCSPTCTHRQPLLVMLGPQTILQLLTVFPLISYPIAYLNYKLYSATLIGGWRLKKEGTYF